MSTPARIELEHVYAQSPAAVWRALTDPELLARWWVPGDVRPVVGHAFTLDMGAFGKQACVVLEVEPERLFRYRFATGVLDTTITWRLAPEGAGTRLTLVHEGFDLDSPLSKTAFEGMGKGWPKKLGDIAGLLASIAA